MCHTLVEGVRIVVRRIAVALVVALLVGCGSPARFSGHGYSIQIPTDPEFTYSHDSDNMSIHDSWVVKTQPNEGLVVEVIDPLPADWPTTLDGALERAQQVFAIMDYPDPTVTAVTLPAGSGYQLDATGSLGAVRMYVFFKGGRYVVVDFAGVPTTLSDQIINSLALD